MRPPAQRLEEAEQRAEGHVSGDVAHVGIVPARLRDKAVRFHTPTTTKCRRESCPQRRRDAIDSPCGMGEDLRQYGALEHHLLEGLRGGCCDAGGCGFGVRGELDL
jgi:hypothetical protein